MRSSVWTPRRRSEWLTLVGLALALGGYWWPWLTTAPAALRLNGFELSEWSMFLPAVRDGSLPAMRLPLLAPLACLSGLLALCAARRHRRPARSLRGLAAWLPDTRLGGALLLLALGSAAAVFPQYPYLLTAYKDPEFQLQLLVAAAALLGAGLALLLPDDLAAVLQALLAAAGGYLGWRSFIQVRPGFLELLPTWSLSPAWPLMLLGFALLALAGAWRLFEPQR